MSTSLLIAAALIGFQQAPEKSASRESVIAPGAKLEKVFGDGEFTEGGAMDADGSILFSDIGNRILRFDPKTGKTTVFREPSGRANGMMFDGQGPAHRGRGRQHRRRPAGLDHRTRRHHPDPGRRLQRQAIQQPQ